MDEARRRFPGLNHLPFISSSDARSLDGIGSSETVSLMAAAGRDKMRLVLEVKEGSKVLGRRNRVQDFSLHILDLVENSIHAGAQRVEIRIAEDSGADMLAIEIADDGRGMNREMAEKSLDPSVTTRTTGKMGLGLSLFAQAARACNGGVSIESEPGRGAKLKGTFQASHIDRKPWGSMVDTLVTLIAGNPRVSFYYHHRKDDTTYSLDTETIKKELGEVPVSDPRVIRLLRGDLEDGLAQLGVQ